MENNTIEQQPVKAKGKSIKLAAIVLSCSLVGSALGAGGVALVNRFLSKPDMRIERSFDGQKQNDFPGRPQDGSANDSQNGSQNGPQNGPMNGQQGAPQNGQFPSADQNNNTPNPNQQN